MSSRKEKFVDKAVAIVYRGDAPLRTSKLPPALQFPLIIILSLSSSALLYSFAAGYTASELASVSRSLSEWWEVGALVAWRAFELGLGWFGNYDGYDLASLSILSHGPHLYLLSSFYNIGPATILTSLVIDALTTYVPFRLLRPLSLAHAASKSSKSAPVPNRDIVTDLPIQVLTAILAAGVYSVTLYTACATYLPVALAIYFNNIPSVAAAHSATYISLLPLTLVLGLAARSFIFTPAVASPLTQGPQATPFNPVTATLAETFRYNFWNYRPTTKAIITRTATLMLASGISTFLQVFVNIEGVEIAGAATYASVWVTAAFLTGISLGVVGAV